MSFCTTTAFLKTSDFDYDLPESFIAQTPIEPRDSSRLLVLHRETGKIEHRIFREIGEYLHPNDVLVLNQTRVIPARLYARKASGGRVELLLLRRRDATSWEALAGGKGLSVGKNVRVENGPQAEIVEVLNGSQRLIRFEEPIEPFFPKAGNVPLPPYIHEKLADPERYQTVYAHEPGSAAAPTAGLHFTPEALGSLGQSGVEKAIVTLHASLGTFRPVKAENVEEHTMHPEEFELSEVAAGQVNRALAEGRRVVCVGTTTVRVLEGQARELTNDECRMSNVERPNPGGLESRVQSPKSGGVWRVRPGRGQTDLYIYPGYEWKVVGALLTNFHLPKSTLLMLVSAFAGREAVLAAYRHAIEQKYRFYSFGDAMLVV